MYKNHMNKILISRETNIFTTGLSTIIATDVGHVNMTVIFPAGRSKNAAYPRSSYSPNPTLDLARTLTLPLDLARALTLGPACARALCRPTTKIFLFVEIS